MRLKGAFVMAVGTLMSCIAFWALRVHFKNSDLCEMTYSRPAYVELGFDSLNSKVSSKYRLYLYREGGVSPRYETVDDVGNLGGTPVLFIPGNAGSYKQGRSLASASADDHPEYDWFLVDFDEDFSAMHGNTLVDESRYVNDAIAYILKLYQSRGGEQEPPKSVIIVAHSMGGIVSRALVMLENYVGDSVNTILTLSTPHAYPPITFDRDITQLYDLVNQWWRSKATSADIALVSLTGGHEDLLVLPDMAVADSIGGLTAFSYEVPGAGIGIDHLAIVWCQQMRDAIVEAINDIVDHHSPQRTLPFETRMTRLTKRLKHPRSSEDEKSAQYTAGPSILWGGTMSLDIKGPTDIKMPKISSLMSFAVDSDTPVQLSHRTGKEYRDYGVVEEATLIWYSSGPFVPFTEVPEDLILHLDILKDTENVSEGKIQIHISVNWLATLGNIAIHYRTLAACWPFAIILITLMTQVSRQGGISFETAFYSFFLNRWFFLLAAVLSILHCALTFSDARALLRLAQIPSEAKNVTSLHSRGFDAHDLLLGINDMELFWIAPLLLSIASCAAALVLLVSNLIVEIRIRASGLLAGRRSNGTAGSVQSKPHDSSTRSAFGSTLIGSVLLLFVTYALPYQVTTVLLAIIQLLRVRDRKGISFGISQLLLWTSVVDAPIVIVWARNLTLEWLWAFASLRNIFSSLPIAILVLYSDPDTGLRSLRSPLARILILTLMAYIVTYAFTYSGLHAFMLHHLTSYLIAVLLLSMMAA